MSTDSTTTPSVVIAAAPEPFAAVPEPVAERTTAAPTTAAPVAQCAPRRDQHNHDNDPPLESHLGDMGSDVYQQCLQEAIQENLNRLEAAGEIYYEPLPNGKPGGARPIEGKFNGVCSRCDIECVALNKYKERMGM